MVMSAEKDDDDDDDDDVMCESTSSLQVNLHLCILFLLLQLRGGWVADSLTTGKGKAEVCRVPLG